MTETLPPILVNVTSDFLVYLREAVDLACTCGGGGPGDGCPACEVWHMMREFDTQSEVTVKISSKITRRVTCKS